jgi:large subunit ribosomal protein L18e
VKNPELIATIRALEKASRGGAALWRALAEELKRPRRIRAEVNLSRIDRHSKDGDIVAVPGKVLGSGSLSHPVTVAAFSFSRTARQKIQESDGKAITLRELLSSNVEPSRIKILK